MKPYFTGIALSLTVSVFYSLCTLIWVMAPERFMDFMNSLFHGIDFRLLRTPEAYAWNSFAFALICLAIWGLLVGTFFAWIQGLLSKCVEKPE